MDHLTRIAVILFQLFSVLYPLNASAFGSAKPKVAFTKLGIQNLQEADEAMIKEATSGHARKVEKLLIAGASAHYKPPGGGETAFIEAIKGQHVSTVCVILLSDPTVIFQTTENGTPTLGLTSNEVIRKMVQKEFYKFCEQFIESHLCRQDRMRRSDIEDLEYHYWRQLMDVLRYQQRRAIHEYRQTILNVL